MNTIVRTKMMRVTVSAYLFFIVLNIVLCKWVLLTVMLIQRIKKQTQKGMNVAIQSHTKWLLFSYNITFCFSCTKAIYILDLEDKKFACLYLHQNVVRRPQDKWAFAITIAVTAINNYPLTCFPFFCCLSQKCWSHPVEQL